MNIDNLWQVKIFKGQDVLCQYVEAKYCDEAINNAKKTFQSSLYNMSDKKLSTSTQKADKRVLLSGKYRIGFIGPSGAGHKTLNVDNKSIFDLISEAYSNDTMGWMDGAKITEIYSN